MPDKFITLDNLSDFKELYDVYVASKLASPYDTTHSYSVGDVATHNSILYVCTVATTGAWDSSKWQQVNVATLLDNKQDTLISGTNIKTINNESLLESGNIDTPQIRRFL